MGGAKYSEISSPELSNAVFGSRIGKLAWQIARRGRNGPLMGGQGPGNGIPHRVNILVAPLRLLILLPFSYVRSEAISVFILLP